jgi:hypothetical protein
MFALSWFFFQVDLEYFVFAVMVYEVLVMSRDRMQLQSK